MMADLLILSVPNVRVIRVLLTELVFQSIPPETHVLIVTPFARDEAFSNEFADKNRFFYALPPRNTPSPWTRVIYSFSELMRTLGYYRKHKHRGLRYYWVNSTKQFGEKGADKKDPFSKLLIKKIASVVGLWPKAWRYVESCVSKAYYVSPSFEKILEPYQKVSLIQASSWGEQDKLLAWYARKLKFKTILLPYTTDQLWVNGYLLCDYEVICSQGTFEHYCATHYHKVPLQSILSLGSIWFRTIDAIRQNHALIKPSNAYATILYAGVGKAYFPRESEFAAIDTLLLAMHNKTLSSAKLIYRPYISTEEERSEIIARYGNETHIELQWPEEVCAGLYHYSGGAIAKQLLTYIQNLLMVDVLIMSHTTSLGLDAAYLGSAVLAYFADYDNILAQRKTEYRFLPNKTLEFAQALPIVHSSSELLVELNTLLGDKDKRQALAKAIVASWDYLEANTSHLLRQAIHGEKRLLSSKKTAKRPSEQLSKGA